MASDRKSWEKHVAKIMSLFQGNADSRQQAFLLLDSLITGPLEEGIADILQPIFTGCDFSDASFLWMTQVEQRLDYSSRQSFRKEDFAFDLNTCFEIPRIGHPKRQYFPIVLHMFVHIALLLVRPHR